MEMYKNLEFTKIHSASCVETYRRARRTKRRMSLIQDGRRLALLKRSVGRDHTEPRPLYPIQVAEYIEEMKSELEDPTGEKTAKRLGISTSLMSDFTCMISLPEKLHYVFGWGPYRGGSIPWSAFRRAGLFLKNGTITQDDLEMLVNGVLQEQIPTYTVEDMLYLKKKNPDKTMVECCREILNVIPVKITYVVFISDLDPDVEKALRKAAADKDTSPDDLAESVLSKRLGEDTKGVLIKNGQIKIALTEKGRKSLDDVAEEEKIMLADVVNHILLKDGLGL